MKASELIFSALEMLTNNEIFKFMYLTLSSNFWHFANSHEILQLEIFYNPPVKRIKKKELSN